MYAVVQYMSYGTILGTNVSCSRKPNFLIWNVVVMSCFHRDSNMPHLTMVITRVSSSAVIETWPAWLTAKWHQKDQSPWPRHLGQYIASNSGRQFLNSIFCVFMSVSRISWKIDLRDFHEGAIGYFLLWTCHRISQYPRVFSMALGLGSNQLRLQGCIPGKGCMDHWTAVVP